MTDEQIDALFLAFDKAVQTVGGKTFDETFREVIPPLSAFLDLLGRFQDRKAARIFLRKYPGEDVAGFKNLIERIPGMVYELRDKAPPYFKMLPHRPGGRPVEIPTRDRGKICEEIGTLLVKGASPGVAYKRVAQRRNVSARTIYRVWKERKREIT